MQAEARFVESLLPGSRPVEERSASTIGDVADFLKQRTQPIVIRGLASDEPLVRHGRQSTRAIADYLAGFYSGAPLIASLGPAEIKGRIGYDHDLTGFNYQRTQMGLGEFFGHIQKCADADEPPTVYIGSSMLDHWFPGLADELSLIPSKASPLVSLWLGNRVVVSAHFDFPHNLACCVAGRRRFTLLPPEQLANLYVGPWDVTPAGQPISLVDFRNPDYERFPRFAEACAAAQEVVLEPGDAVFIPSMWWHHVEGLDDLNILLNYWWRDTPAYMGTPLNVLKHAFMTIKGLPIEERQAWREIFDYYVFDASDDAVAHIPEGGRGIHGDMDENYARVLRAELLKALNR